MRPELMSPIRFAEPAPRSRQPPSQLGKSFRAWFLSAALVAAAAIAAGCDEESTAPEHQHRAAAIALSTTSFELEAGQQLLLTMTAVCSCGSPVDVNVVWASDNASVATVSPAGLVTAVGSGSATITASAVGKHVTATVTVPEHAGFSLRSVGGSVDLLKQGEGHMAIRIARTGGFDGPVAFTAEDAPVGMEVTLSSAVVADNFEEVFLSTESALPAGTYHVTVLAAAEGLPTRTLDVPVHVLGPDGADFLLRPMPEWITVERGSAVQTTIRVTRTDALLWGWIGLGIVGAPAGFTWEFAPADGFDFTASTLSIAVAPGVAVGTYDLAVQGILEAWGNERWTHVHVTVVEAPEPPEFRRR